MGGQDETAHLVQAVAGLGRVVGQVAAVLEQHGRMQQRLLEMAAKPEEARLDVLIVVLIGRLDRRAGVLEHMEARFGQIGTAVEQERRSRGAQVRGRVRQHAQSWERWTPRYRLTQFFTARHHRRDQVQHPEIHHPPRPCKPQR